MLLKGYPISKQDYKEELETQISIFQVKHGIYKTNQKIAQTTDEAQIKAYKQFNAKEFSKLKELYGKLRPGRRATKRGSSSRRYQKQIQSQKQIRRSTIQQTQGSLKVDINFMRNLTASLKQAQRSSQKPLWKELGVMSEKNRKNAVKIVVKSHWVPMAFLTLTCPFRARF